MTTVTIELNDATELEDQNWLAPLAKRSISLTAREIKMGDARDAGRVLGQVDEAGGDLYGYISRMSTFLRLPSSTALGW